MLLSQFFRAGRNHDPNKMAIHCGAIHLSYGRLFDDIERVAARLSDMGVRPGDTVAVDIDKPISHWLTTLAMMRVGAVSVSLTRNFVAEVACIPRLAAVISGPNELRSFPSNIRQIYIEQDWLDAPLPLRDALTPMAEAGELVGRICFTSGTSGQPKAILLDSKLLTARLAGTARRSKINSDSVFWCGLGPDTAYGFSAPVATWMAGGAVVLASGGEGSLAQFHDLNVNLLISSPAALQPLVREAVAKTLARLEATTIVAGGRLSVGMRNELLEHLCTRVLVAYGSSEAGGITRGDAMKLDQNPGFVGAFFPDVDVEIVDDNNVVLPREAKGRLRVRTDSMVADYINDPIATEQSFRAGWFTSGDLAQITADGFVIVLGRPANTLNLGGVKLAIEEIESNVRGMAEVDDACAILLTINGLEQLGLVVVTHAKSANDLGARIRSAMPTMPGFCLISVQSIPRGSMGKINRDVMAQSVSENLCPPGTRAATNGAALLGTF